MILTPSVVKSCGVTRNPSCASLRTYRRCSRYHTLFVLEEKTRFNFLPSTLRVNVKKLRALESGDLTTTLSFNAWDTACDDVVEMKQVAAANDASFPAIDQYATPEPHPKTQKNNDTEKPFPSNDMLMMMNVDDTPEKSILLEYYVSSIKGCMYPLIF